MTIDIHRCKSVDVSSIIDDTQSNNSITNINYLVDSIPDSTFFTTITNNGYGVNYDIFDTVQNNISSWLAQGLDPQTIVWNLTSQVPNLTFTTCVSTCIFHNTTFFNTTSFVTNIPGALSCIAICFNVPTNLANSSSVGGADGTSSLQQQIAQLKGQKSAQLKQIDDAHKKTIDFYIDIIKRNLGNLAIVLASFALFIAMRQEHEGESIIALLIKKIGKAIEYLVGAFKAICMGLQQGDAMMQATAAYIEIQLALAAAKQSISTFFGELMEQISGLGSAIVSSGDIIGSLADILFDVKRIIFDFMGLGGQISQHVIQLDWTEGRITEAISNIAGAKATITSKYDTMIASKEGQMDYKKMFDSQVEGTIPAEYSGYLDKAQGLMQSRNTNNVSTESLIQQAQGFIPSDIGVA
jgi:hypothetical protein